jgi:hypothetical protein
LELEKTMRNEYFDKRWPEKFNLTLNKLLCGFAGFCLAFCVVTEILIPYKTELLPTSQIGAWFPSLCGFGIGCLNLLAAYTVGQGVGSSTGYGAVTSLLLFFRKENSFVNIKPSESETNAKNTKDWLDVWLRWSV